MNNMRYLKTFERFELNETQDMMFMPVDPIKNSAEAYSDIAELVGGSFNVVERKVDEAVDAFVADLGSEAVDVLKSIEKFFGVAADKLTYELAKAKIQKLNESLVDDYDAADPYDGEHMATPLKDVKGGLFQKVCSLIQRICAVNILSAGAIGTFVTWILEKCTGAVSVENFAWSLISAIVAFIVVHIIRKIDTAIRNKFA
jgi:hypothetical protein